MQRHLLCLILHVFKCFGIIASGVGITHHDNGCVSSLYCRCGSGLNIFFGGETGISEVYVDIHKTGGNDKPLRIYDFLFVFRGDPTVRFKYYFSNAAVTDPEVRFRLKAALRIRQ